MLFVSLGQQMSAVGRAGIAFPLAVAAGPGAGGKQHVPFVVRVVIRGFVVGGECGVSDGGRAQQSQSPFSEFTSSDHGLSPTLR